MVEEPSVEDWGVVVAAVGFVARVGDLAVVSTVARTVEEATPTTLLLLEPRFGVDLGKAVAVAFLGAFGLLSLFLLFIMVEILCE